MLADISAGTQAMAKGAKLLLRPEIRLYVVIPLLINLVLFGGLIWLGYQQFYPFVEWIMSFVPGFLDFIEWLIWLLVGTLAAVTVFFTFTPIANIVAAPFNALMSEKLEVLLTGEAVSSETSFLDMAIASIGSQLRKLVYIMLWGLGLFLFSLIPVLNFIAPVLWVVFGSWLLSLEYLDYPMGNHDLSFSAQKDRLRQRRGLALGFGGSVMIMTSIPLVNFIAMPVAVAGATVLWVEELIEPLDN
ncbi:MAG: CysZ protein [Gammaproteobacteria bacterium]|jgi:CysZ protein